MTDQQEDFPTPFWRGFSIGMAAMGFCIVLFKIVFLFWK